MRKFFDFYVNVVFFYNNIFQIIVKNRFMKKKFLGVFAIIILCAVFMCGCQNETELRVAYISDITGALSTNYAVKVVRDKDERVEDKFFDLQLKSNKDEQIVHLNEENGSPIAIFLEKKDTWYNLTYLIGQTNGASVPAKLEKYDKGGSKVYSIKVDNDVELTMRVVVGDEKQNTQTGEKILVLSKEISDEFTLKCKKNIEK